jgi:hypothetical protein
MTEFSTGGRIKYLSGFITVLIGIPKEYVGNGKRVGNLFPCLIPRTSLEAHASCFSQTAGGIRTDIENPC